MTRHLFLVSRHHPDLYDYMREHFVTEPDVEVILDRRRAQRRRRAMAVTGERRSGERRTRSRLDAEIRTETYAFLTVP